MNYYDANYIVRLYLREQGWAEVRELRTPEAWICSLHGRAEVFAAMHRKLREGVISSDELRRILMQFAQDSDGGAFHWLPLSADLIDRLGGYFRNLPPSVFLRAADAMHLASAREHGCSVVYSNDKRLLSAAESFGLRGKNVIV